MFRHRVVRRPPIRHLVPKEKKREDEKKEKEKKDPPKQKKEGKKPNAKFMTEKQLDELSLVIRDRWSTEIVVILMSYLWLPNDAKKKWDLIWAVINSRLPALEKQPGNMGYHVKISVIDGKPTQVIKTCNSGFRLFRDLFCEFKIMTQGVECFGIEPRDLQPLGWPGRFVYKVGKQPSPPAEGKEEDELPPFKKKKEKKPTTRVWLRQRNGHIWEFQVESWQVSVEVPTMKVIVPDNAPKWLLTKMINVFRIGGNKLSQAHAS